MANVTAAMFNGLMDDFLTALRAAFPRNTSIVTAHEAFGLMANSSDLAKKKLPMTMFMDGVRPHAQCIRDRNTQYMSEHMDSIEFIRSLDMKKYWDSDRMPEATRTSIWDYLTQLLQVGTLTESVPAEMLPLVDKFTQSDAFQAIQKKVGQGEQPDMAEVFSSVAAFASAEGIQGVPGAGLPPNMHSLPSASASASAAAQTNKPAKSNTSKKSKKSKKRT